MQSKKSKELAIRYASKVFTVYTTGDIARIIRARLGGNVTASQVARFLAKNGFSIEGKRVVA